MELLPASRKDWTQHRSLYRGRSQRVQDDFPYIEEYVQVRVEEPKAATVIKDADL